MLSPSARATQPPNRGAGDLDARVEQETQLVDRSVSVEHAGYGLRGPGGARSQAGLRMPAWTWRWSSRSSEIDAGDEILSLRDDVVSGWDDAEKAERHAAQGVTILRGNGRLSGRGLVAMVDEAPRPLPGEEPEVGDLLARRLGGEGIEVVLGTEAAAIARDGARSRLALRGGGERTVERVVCDPEVAAVGLTASGAREAGLDVAVATLPLHEVERGRTYGREVDGRAGVVADRRARVLVCAHAVGPLAAEWVHLAVLAVRARVQVDVLCDTIVQFPTFSDALISAARELDL